MKVNWQNIKLVLLFSVISFYGFSQTENETTRLYLFTDRDYCISGDTLWFKITGTKSGSTQSNVVHVHLTNANSQVIESVIKKSNEGWAEGFLHVPDSLSTGVYFLSAFFYEHLSVPDIPVEKKSLFVYNRFQGDLTEMAVPGQEQNTAITNLGRSVEIKPNKKEYNPREKVTVELGLDAIETSETAFVAVRASRVDEMARSFGGRFISVSTPSDLAVPNFAEKDGFILSGKVKKSTDGVPPQKAVVFLSLIDDPGYFDYYVTGQEGTFHFFMKDAEGVGDVVLQAVSENGAELAIELATNRMETRSYTTLQQQPLRHNQIDFINQSNDAMFIKRLFGENYTIPPTDFSMPPRFNVPFYGHPDRSVNLDEFFELPDFREVSRELLPGVQYRNRDGNITIRMLNLDENVYFENEPFRLINGIPVFRNRLFSSFGSAEIDKVEYAMEERIFGDLKFTGLLAIYLKDKSNRWLAHQSNIYRFTVPFFQTAREPGYFSPPENDKNIPDLRTVYFWQRVPTGEKETIEFLLSDIKGKVEISVAGVTKDGKIFNTSEIIEIK
jgi:hypothetical protein